MTNSNGVFKLVCSGCHKCEKVPCLGCCQCIGRAMCPGCCQCSFLPEKPLENPGLDYERALAYRWDRVHQRGEKLWLRVYSPWGPEYGVGGNGGIDVYFQCASFDKNVQKVCELAAASLATHHAGNGCDCDWAYLADRNPSTAKIWRIKFDGHSSPEHSATRFADDKRPLCAKSGELVGFYVRGTVLMHDRVCKCGCFGTPLKNDVKKAKHGKKSRKKPVACNTIFMHDHTRNISSEQPPVRQSPSTLLQTLDEIPPLRIPPPVVDGPYLTNQNDAPITVDAENDGSWTIVRAGGTPENTNFTWIQVSQSIVSSCTLADLRSVLYSVGSVTRRTLAKLSQLSQVSRHLVSIKRQCYKCLVFLSPLYRRGI